MKLRQMRHRRFTRSTVDVLRRALWRALEACVSRPGFMRAIGTPRSLPTLCDRFTARRHIPFAQQ